MVDEGVVKTRRTRQRHFFYSLSKKGEKEIGLVSSIFSNYSKGLLRVHFKDDAKMPDTQRYFLKRTVNRMGLFLVCAVIEGIFQHTSPNKSKNENRQILQEWLEGINPTISLVNYLGGLAIHFGKYADDDEVDMPIFNSKKKLQILKDFQKTLERLYPDETDFLKNRVNELEIQYKEEQLFRKSKKGSKTAAREYLNLSLLRK